MTGTEARGFIVHGRLNDEQTLKAVQEVLMKIGALGGFTDSVPINAGAPRTPVDLPADFLRVTYVYNDRNRPYYRYRVMRLGNGFQIMFENAGSYQVHYTTATPEYTDITHEIPLHSEYDPAVIEYLKGYAMLKENPNSPAGHNRIESAISLALKARNALNRNSARWGVRGR